MGHVMGTEHESEAGGETSGTALGRDRARGAGGGSRTLVEALKRIAGFASWRHRVHRLGFKKDFTVSGSKSPASDPPRPGDRLSS